MACERAADLAPGQSWTWETGCGTPTVGGGENPRLDGAVCSDWGRMLAGGAAERIREVDWWGWASGGGGTIDETNWPQRNPEGCS
jgi:hypothetical protein